MHAFELGGGEYDAPAQLVADFLAFPAEEGAGYAGGILSAGLDGIKAAEAVALSITGMPPGRSASRRAILAQAVTPLRPALADDSEAVA